MLRWQQADALSRLNGAGQEEQKLRRKQLTRLSKDYLRTIVPWFEKEEGKPNRAASPLSGKPTDLWEAQFGSLKDPKVRAEVDRLTAYLDNLARSPNPTTEPRRPDFSNKRRRRNGSLRPQ